MKAIGSYSSFKSYASRFSRPNLLYSSTSFDLSGHVSRIRLVDDAGGMVWRVEDDFTIRNTPSVEEFLSDFPKAILVTQLAD